MAYSALQRIRSQIVGWALSIKADGLLRYSWQCPPYRKHRFYSASRLRAIHGCNESACTFTLFV